MARSITALALGYACVAGPLAWWLGGVFRRNRRHLGLPVIHHPAHGTTHRDHEWVAVRHQRVS